jgi:beta-fructofuranosidase
MSLPRVYSLAEDNSLMVEPVAEVEALRFDHQRIEAISIPADEDRALPNIGGKAIELKAVFRLDSAEEVGLKVLQSPDDSECTVIRFSSDQTLSIDTEHASLNKDILERPPETGPLTLEGDEALELRVFIDRSIVEVFANGRQCLCVRVYPTQDNSSGISVFSKGGEAELLGFDIWQMHSVWPELKNKEGAV